ncbi:microtubule-associated protein futsch [Anopheles nili]|uniref:microtubule-associated protein futsch n=1 Tax=Anopheles nili TaxID=185578 RepID=UPI00237BB0FF|nr:microtubule-associated protein futsch [Anopheles nili]
MEQDQDQMEPMEVNGDGHQGGTIDIGAGSDGPPSMVGVGPPSPLTGCYLLIIIGEPHSQDHKDIILQRLIKGFLSWNVIDCHVDLEDELHTITLQALDGEEGKHGERLIQYASENLVTEILIHPQVNTFIQCIRNLLSSFTRHRHIIHTGYTFSGNGSWILQDGTFSVVDFMEAFQEHEVQRVLRAYPDTITMDVHCAPIGQWHTIQDKSFSRFCQIRMNPVDVLSSGSEKLNSFVAYLSSMIIPTEISELLESSDVVGNIRFSHPTLYVFPGGQGDAALFGINGFNMLVDGGFSRKSCFWDFVRHLDRLDAVLMTRINNTNIKGISSVVERKSEAHVYPQIGHFFCNIPERKSLPSPDGDKDRDPLLVDIIQEGHQIVTNLKSLNLKAQTCYRDIEPINLYHKVGHGTLDMYVISPARDSREVKDFLTRWAADDMRLFTKEAKEGKDFAFPLHNLISICALLVWTPANPEDNITRILFPGSAPEYKILEGLEKMKNVEFMRQPVCPVKSISASLSTPVLVTKKSLKSASTDRILAEPIHSSKSKDNKLIDNKMKMMHVDNKLAADMMDSSADEGKMEKQLSSKLQGTATVASAKVESKSKSTRSGKSIVSAEKKFDNKKMEQQHDEKKDSISDISSDKEDQLFMDKSKPLAVDSEKSLDEPLDTQEKIAETESAKPELDTKEKKKEDAPSTGADSVGVAVKATKKPPVSRTLTSATARSKVETSGKGSKSTVERKPIVKKQTEANKSSPTTPKKIGSIEAKLLNGNAEDTKKTVGKSATTKATPVVGGKPGKSSPKATPAKSTKDENNRKVLEARQRPTTVAKRDTLAARKEVEKKELLSTKAQTERKPISRRPKGAAPAPSSVAPIGGSPVKGKKVLKSEKDAVIRKAKLDKNGTTDSSLVSTPSADEAVVPVTKRAAGMAPTEVAPSDSDALDAIKKQQQLAELKEEQEAVREIEAVFNRDSAAQKALKHRELALAEDHREVQDSATEPEEEEEYLIIEKEEQYTEDSINEPESSATKEEEIQKHQRDSQESEKRKRDSLEEDKGEKIDSVKDVGEAGDVEEIQGDGKSDTPLLQGEGEQEPRAEEDHDEREKDEQGKLSPQHKQELEEEVQEIIASAKEIAKSKMETSMDGLKTEEISSISPDEKISSTKKTSDTRDEEQEHPLGHMKDHIDPPLHESHHEERVSATVESGATTTAPTLPEDERIPLDEIKEDLVIEEKHVKEQTKEIEVVTTVATDATAAIRAELPSGPELAPENVATATAPLQTVYEPLERPTPAKMQFSAQQAHMRDVVKTPDEVADLPVHEEADIDEDYTEDKDKNIKESEEKDRDTKEMPEEEVAGAVSSARLAPTIAALETDAKQLEKTDDGRNVADKSVKSDKLCDTAMKVTAVEELIEKVNQDAQVETPRKLDAHHTEQHDPSKAILDDDAILRDLESQIIPAETPVGAKLDNIVHVELQHQVKLEEETLVHGIVGDKSMHPVEEELIVAKKAVPRIPQPPVTSVLDDIWQTPDKAEEKLEELKHFIDDKAKNSVPELVAIKDTMVKSVVEHKDEINDKVLDGTKETDLKIKDVIEDVSQNVEQMAVQTAEEVVKVVTGKVDSVLDNLQEKTKQVDDVLMTTATNLDEKVASFATDVSQVVTKTDEALASITAEKNELEQLAKELKQDMIGQLDDTRKQLDDDFARNVEKLQDKAKTGISSFFGSITEGIKSGIEKVSDKVEHKMKDKVEEVEAKLQQVTEKIDVLKTTSQEPIPLEKEPTYDRFGGAYERSFTQELRETHITTVDSPVTEGDKMSMELKAMVNIPHDIDEDKELEELEAKKNLGTFVIEDIKYSVFEDANLREIKEEEEEDRVSPPQGTSEKLSTVLGMMPPRARTPEDVAKIVANVAEVLKSDKDLEDIIPGFDPQELERKLSQGAAREEDVGTVQRMLVTASSEDGGEETVICADGTITFSKSVTPEPMQTSGTTTPEIKVQEENEDDEEEGAEDHVHASSKDATVGKRTSYEKGSPISSGKSSPDLKTSPTSIEEKDKHELPEKIVQIDASKSKSHQELPTTVSDTCKDSVPDHQTYDLIDDTRRESAISTFSERDYTKDESSFVDERDSSRAHSISSHISDLKDDSADLKSVTDFLKESEKERDQVFADADIKLKELSSPESVASQNMITEKVSKILEANETHTQESSKPIDTIELDSKDKADSMDFSRPDSPASAEDISHDDVISAKDGQYARDAETTNVRVHLKESASLDLAEELPDTKQFSRPESPASAEELSQISDHMSKESRPASAASLVTDKAPSKKSVDLKTEIKTDSRPSSAASGTGFSFEKSVDLKAEAKSDSRPASAASAPDDKAPSEKSVDLKEETKEDSRPASAASGTDTKAAPQNSVDLKAGAKEDSRPASAASGADDKALSEKSIDLKAEIKEDSRPASAASVPDDKAASVKSVDLKAETKEDSRPASAASGTDAKAASENSADLKAEAKEDSRPASAASGADIKASSDKSVDVKADSRPASAASAPDDKAASVKSVDLKAETKEDSRPASAASGTDAKASPENTVDLKAEAKADSRPASAASGPDDKAPSEKSIDLKAEIKEDSRPASAASGADIKASSDKSVDVKADSRPASSASAPDDKAASVKSVDLKAETKEDSRPASAASGTDAKASPENSADLKAEAKEDSRPASAASGPDDKAISEKSVDLKAETKEDSRPASAASGADIKASSDKSVDVKADSRPASSASAPDDKAASEKSVELRAEIHSDSRPASAVSVADEKSSSVKSVDLKTALKEDSRPASAASGLDDKAISEKSVDLKAEAKADSRPASAASGPDDKAPSEKSIDLKAEIKEDSRPASAASGADIKPSSDKSVDVKADSRPASAASGPDDKAISEKSVDIKAEAKEDSRPASAASGADIKPSSDKSVDVKADSRPASATSAPDDKAASEKSVELRAEIHSDSRPASAVSVADEKSSSVKSVDLKTALKEDSRPASAASGLDDKAISEKSVDLKAEIKEDSRPASAASGADDKALSEKSVDLKAEIKEDSRPASAASGADIKASSDKSVDVKADSRPASSASAPDDKAASVKSVDLKAETKEDSRPASAASGTDAKASPENTVDLKAEAKEDSRPASAASGPDDKAISEKSVDLKAETKEDSRPASAASGADIKASSDKSVDVKADSRPASSASAPDDKAASVKSVDLKAETKEDSRPASAASGTDAKASPENTVDLKAGAKEDSRPASAASGPDDKAISEKSVDLKAEIKEDSRPSSAASPLNDKTVSKKSVDIKSETKEDSRPASAASAPDDKAPSEQSVVLTAEAKSDSRPISAASAPDDKAPSEKSVDLKAEIKEDSRPASAASAPDDNAASDRTVDIKSETKEDSRPASAASAPDDKAPSEQSVDLKTDNKANSRPASAASVADDKAISEKSLDLKTEPKTDSRPASAASGTDIKASLEKPVDLKADSRPASAASAPDDKAASENSADLKAETKEDSRPASAASAPDDKAPSEQSVDLKAEPKIDSRPASAASGADIKASSDKSVDLKPETKEDTRSPSAASGADDKAASEKSVDLKAEAKEDSRPASVASETDAKADSKKSVDLKAEPKTDSRPASAASGADDKASSEKNVDLKAETKADSRPASAASGTDTKADSQKSVDLKAETKEDSRPASAASGADDKAPSVKSVDLKAETKEDSRPASAASGTDAKADSQKSVDLKAETKEISRPTSAGGGVDDKAPFENSVDQKAENTADARPVSAASGVDYKAFCEKSVDLKEETQTDSRPASAASALSEKATSEQSADVKAEPTSASRPASSASGIVDQAPYEKFVDMQPDIKTTSRPASSASCISEHAYSEKSVDMEVKIKAESEKIETKVESCAAQFETIQKSSSTVANMCPLSDGEDDDLEKKICMKETRSKSMSAAVTSVGHRSGFEGSSLGVLEESIITSRDDLDMLRTSRDNTVESTKSQLQTEKAPMKPLKPLFSEFPATKDEDQKYEPNSVFPKCGLDSAESPEHGAAIIAGTDQLLKDTVISMKEVEKMTSSVISSTVVKKEESSTESKTSSTVFPVSANVESGKSSPYLGEKSHESSAKSVSPQPDKDSLEESSVSMNTFIEKDSLSESTSKHHQQIVTSVSVTKESSSEMFAIAQKTGDELLLAGTKTPPTAPISPNVSAKEGSGMGQTHFEASILDGATSASSMATTMASSVTASTGPIAQKDDVSGISTPKESVPSGKSSPGLMSVHTQGSTDSASKSMNLGHSSSGIETSDSSPKPTSPFPKVVVDTLKLADETKTTSGMSTPDMTRSSTPDMVDSQIERIISTEGERSDSQTTVTTTTTTTKTSTYIVKDGQKIEVDSNVQSDRVINTETQDQKASEGSSGATSITTVTTTYVVKDGEKVEIESNVNTGILEQTYDGVTSAKSSAPVQLTLAGTEERSLAEDYDEKDVLSPRSDISSGQASRIVAGWHDEDVPGSPMSMTSQAPLSPSTKYTYDYDLQHSSSGVSKKSDIEIDQDSQDDIVPPQYGSDEAKSAMPIMSSYKPDPMSTSFYGQLPEVPSTMPLGPTATRSIPIPITGSGKSFSKPYVEYASSGESSVDSGHKASVTMSSDRKYLDEADLDFEKAFSGTRKTDDLMTTSMHFSSEKEFMTATTTIASLAQTQKMEMDFTSTGLPSSVTTTVTGAQPSVTAALSQPEQSPQQQPQAQSQSPLPQSTQLAGQAASSSSAEAKSVLDSWGKPLGLPSPAPITSEDNKTTPKKERRMMMTKTKLNNEKNLRKRAESPTKGAAKKAASPVYVDLSYVPHHGNSYYANVEFFKRVRARYYVFSGTEPSREVYNALLEAKQCWEDKELEVTIIPTYDTDVLGYWVSENEELLAKYHIDLSPSAARCTINLQDHETSCSAYRLEF